MIEKVEPLQKKGTMSTRIVNIIKENLIKGHLKAGDKLPKESELMDILGVSRTPLREAIKVLESIGIVEIRRGEGMFITKENSPGGLNPLIFSLILHRENIHSLIEFRQQFEVLMISILKTKASFNIAKIESVYNSQINRMEKKLTPEELVEIDLEFHYTVMEETENPFVIEIGKTIYEIIKPHMIHFKDKKNIERTLKTHKLYLDVLKGEKEFQPNETARNLIKNNEEMIDFSIKNYR
ncbi:Uxu operon regulator [Lentibacillus sp. JNUCC-1]|uniref:FadR/GntR family transcriptional regulator n=1 Tax=Lentibacillus sp. JNUCC-1 TaxID=2654513 RepID=UPI0012E88BD0|nr:GntR family transcriptional regulator [Lentibacillus sp. JNUCC-1]MUV37145.1 Uxu operon regulator [Lentibacillus sp. JNUCC-1]